jgi:cytochrome P450
VETNQWVQRKGRLFLRAKEYFEGVDKAYGVSRSMHSVDGADHFRFRKSLQPAYSRKTLTRRLDDVYDLGRAHMATWNIGDTIPVQTMLRPLLNAQASPLLASIDTQDEIADALKYKMRVLNVGLIKLMPNFMLKTPSMRRRAKATQRIIERMESTHTPGQRVGVPDDVVDAYLGLHASDPQFLPESDLALPLGAILMTSMYMGDQLGFALYWLVKHPELYERVTAEADALWAQGDPSEDDFRPDRIDVTRRVLMEALRVSPIVAMSMRTVMNTCVVKGYKIPVGTKLLIAQTASHYMEESFPDPGTFDIDRYTEPRNEHVGGGYAPYGLGTHSCLGFHWSHLHLAINLLMLTRYFKIEFARPYKRLPMDPLPSQSPSNKLKFRLAEQRHEIRV